MHGKNAEGAGHVGREYWSRRPPCVMLGWGHFGKHTTHRAERHVNKASVGQALEEMAANFEADDEELLDLMRGEDWLDFEEEDTDPFWGDEW